MTTTRPRALADRLERATEACPDVEAVAAAVFATVATSVPFAFACLATTDPATELITRAFKSGPLPIGDAEFAATEYGHADVNRFSDLARRPVPVGVLSIDTDGDVDACRRFREYMAPQFGFTDELRACCRAGGTTWAVVAFYRGAGEPAFTAGEADVLAGVLETVADTVRRILFSHPPVAAPAGGAAVLFLDAQDRATEMTAAAEEHIADLGGYDHGDLPANVLMVAALARAEDQPATTRVMARSGSWLVLRAMPLAGPTTRSVVVTIDAAPASSIGQMTLAARGLTAREQDVAQLVLKGASTTTIASSLFLSPHTVQDHLKAIFRKLGVTSRREMIGRLVSE